MLTPITIKKLRELSSPDLLKPKDQCILWKGTVISAKPVLRMQRATDGTRYKAPIFQKLSARFYLDGKIHYVQRLIYQHLNPTAGSFTLKQVCPTPGCVNHKHWQVRAPKFQTEAPLEFSQDADWTLQDATDLIDRYLMSHPHPPLDETHDLLIDIPHSLLLEALKSMGKFQ
jgi:hypothetical protein